MATVAAFDAMHLDGVVELCRQEGWPTFPADPDRTLRALRAPGTVTVVALDGASVVGFAHAMTDGVTAYLSELLITPAHRGHGLGRELVAAAFHRCGAIRMDLITDTAEDFYAAMPHRRFAGFRIYPDQQ